MNEKNNETKPLYFAKINKIYQLTKKKERRQKLPISLIIENISTDPTDNKRKIIEYCEQLYSDKFDNLEEMDWFLKEHKLPQSTQYKIHNLNYSIAIKKIEFIIKKLMKEILPGPNNFTGNIYWTFKK